MFNNGKFNKIILEMVKFKNKTIKNIKKKKR